MSDAPRDNHKPNKRIWADSAGVPSMVSKEDTERLLGESKQRQEDTPESGNTLEDDESLGMMADILGNTFSEQELLGPGKGIPKPKGVKPSPFKGQQVAQKSLPKEDKLDIVADILGSAFSADELLGPKEVKSSPFLMWHYKSGGPCKPGQSAASTGCVPKSGSGKPRRYARSKVTQGGIRQTDLLIRETTEAAKKMEGGHGFVLYVNPSLGKVRLDVGDWADKGAAESAEDLLLEVVSSSNLGIEYEAGAPEGFDWYKVSVPEGKVEALHSGKSLRGYYKAGLKPSASPEPYQVKPAEKVKKPPKASKPASVPSGKKPKAPAGSSGSGSLAGQPCGPGQSAERTGCKPKEKKPGGASKQPPSGRKPKQGQTPKASKEPKPKPEKIKPKKNATTSEAQKLIDKVKDQGTPTPDNINSLIDTLLSMSPENLAKVKEALGNKTIDRKDEVIEKLKENVEDIPWALEMEEPKKPLLRGMVNVKKEIDKDGGDSKKTAKRVAQKVKEHLDAGGAISIWFEGKKVPIVAVEGGMMRDAEGKPWGTTAIAMGTGKSGIEFTTKPKAKEPKTKPESPKQDTPEAKKQVEDSLAKAADFFTEAKAAAPDNDMAASDETRKKIKPRLEKLLNAAKNAFRLTGDSEVLDKFLAWGTHIAKAARNDPKLTNKKLRADVADFESTLEYSLPEAVAEVEEPEIEQPEEVQAEQEPEVAEEPEAAAPEPEIEKEEQGFTGTDDRGVELVDGIPQKQEDKKRSAEGQPCKPGQTPEDTGCIAASAEEPIVESAGAEETPEPEVIAEPEEPEAEKVPLSEEDRELIESAVSDVDGLLAEPLTLEGNDPVSDEIANDVKSRIDNLLEKAKPGLDIGNAYDEMVNSADEMLRGLKEPDVDLDIANVRVEEFEIGVLQRLNQILNPEVASGEAEGTGRAGDAGVSAGDGGTGSEVEGAAEGSGVQAAGGGGDLDGESTPPPYAKRLPASVEQVARRLDQYEKFFERKGDHERANWVRLFRTHIGSIGVDAALEALGEEQGAGTGEQVQYHDMRFDKLADFIPDYLDRVGIIPMVGDMPLDTMPMFGGYRGMPWDEHEGDWRPGDQAFANKLEESRALPGLEKTEDLSKVIGEQVTHLDDKVMAKLDEKYGKGQWVAKTYSAEAWAGFGVYFPQRAISARDQARELIWASGGPLAKHGFSHLRDKDTNKIVGIKHENGDEYLFGTDKYTNTIGGEVREWGDLISVRPDIRRAAVSGGALGENKQDLAGAPIDNEQGLMLPMDGKEFMVQPAFAAVGATEQFRKEGNTIAPGEARVHLIARNGKVEVIPYSTWIKGAPLPVVFDDDSTKAIALAAQQAVDGLDDDAKASQLFGVDVIKTADGYKIIEVNAGGESASGYLGDNPLIIDSYVSHMTGRDPAHVRFIRNLLSSRKGQHGEGQKPSRRGTRHVAPRQSIERRAQGREGRDGGLPPVDARPASQVDPTKPGSGRPPKEFAQEIEALGLPRQRKYVDEQGLVSPPQAAKEQYNRKVVRAAKASGYFVEPHKFDKVKKGAPNVGGNEHDVYEDSTNSKFFKFTKGGQYGQNADLQEYLERNDIANELWPELGYEFHGITTGDDGQPQAVVSMNRMEGTHPESKEISSWFKEHGWEPDTDNFDTDNDEPTAWRDPKTGITVADATDVNFIKTSQGLVPIDVDIIPKFRKLKDSDRAKNLSGYDHKGIQPSPFTKVRKPPARKQESREDIMADILGLLLEDTSLEELLLEGGV